jgi:hypothetical protein
MRPALAVALVSVVVLAGCVGPGSGGVGEDETDGPLRTDETVRDGTPSRTETTGEQPSRPETVVEPPASASPENTVAYENLTDHQQAAFRAAMDGEAKFVPNTSYVDDSEGFWMDQIGPFRAHEYVRYRGEYYRLEFSSGELYAQYGIDASAGFPDSDEEVVPFSELPENVREEVRQAIETGHHTVPFGKWQSLPEPLTDTDYVRYENQTYALAYAVGDSWAPLMSAERVE